MQEIQKTITDNKILVKFTLNTYETGMFSQESVGCRDPGQTKRGIQASAAHLTMKNMFTAVLTCAGEGGLLVQYLIVACTVGKADMTHVKVIESLHKLAGFTADE